MSIDDIISVLEEMAVLMELKDENPFKIRAFQNGARVLEGVQDLKSLVQEKKLTTIKGIGEHLSKTITELFETGKSKEHTRLRKAFPQTLFEILKLQGLGPKKVKALYKKLKIKSLTELEKACKEDRLLKLEGFQKKTQENILQAIEGAKKRQGRFLYPTALKEAQKLKAYLEKSKAVQKIEIGGSLRRFKDTVKDIDLLVAAQKSKPVMDFFTSYPEVHRVLAKGETKSSLILNAGINVDLRVVNSKEFPFALHYFTGSKAHSSHLRGIAKTKGLKLNEYGLFKGKQSLSCSSEAALFEKLGLSYIEPELREDSGEIEATQKGDKLPHLVTFKDLKGTFHNHTTYSDGRNTLEEMIQAAQDLGLEYIGISDHSPSAYYANGLKPDRLKKQQAEIDQLQKKFATRGKIKILKGTESDIRSDGSLDYPDKILAGFDFVIASIHSNFKMTEKDMTNRIVKALKNKHVTMIGHPTGRLVSKRDAYPVNLYQLVDVAADYGKAMELNAHPERLDIDWHICKYAKSKKVPVSINPDAHKSDGIQVIRYGIQMARKGWLEKKDVLNTRSYEDVMKFLRSYK